MTDIEIFLLFSLPAAIFATGMVGVYLVKLEIKKKKASQVVKVEYDFSNVVRLPAANE